MTKILISWIGMTDLKASRGLEGAFKGRYKKRSISK